MKKISILVAPLLAFSGMGILHFINPNVAGHYPVCPSLWLTGFYCPGCGSLRALHALSNGDFITAWAMNPMMVVSIPFLVLSWIQYTRRILLNKPRSFILPVWTIYSILVLVVCYWILRNVPGFEFLAPGGMVYPR